MDLIWTAFLLGLVGSLHCAGMCGPLLLAFPASRSSKASFIAGRLLYNLGRIATYALIGLIFGLVGRGFALAGLQQTLSVAAGVLLLVGWFASARWNLNRPIFGLLSALKRGFAGLMARPSLQAQFALGGLNGLLPCGLVYVAAAGAAATAAPVPGLAYMAAFGLGTLPVMLGISLAGSTLRKMISFRFEKLIPISIVLVGALLVLRGLSLGIPYISPDLAHTGAHACCH